MAIAVLMVSLQKKSSNLIGYEQRLFKANPELTLNLKKTIEVMINKQGDLSLNYLITFLCLRDVCVIIGL